MFSPMFWAVAAAISILLSGAAMFYVGRKERTKLLRNMCWLTPLAAVLAVGSALPWPNLSKTGVQVIIGFEVAICATLWLIMHNRKPSAFTSLLLGSAVCFLALAISVLDAHLHDTLTSLLYYVASAVAVVVLVVVMINLLSSGWMWLERRHRPTPASSKVTDIRPPEQ